MLLGNYSVLHKSPTKFMSGTIASGDRANWNKGGLQRNMGAGEAMSFRLASIPMGFGAGGAWLIPKTAGGMASRSLGNLKFTPTATLYGGITTGASASMTIAFANASGELISSGSGSANFTIATNNPLLTASIGGAGSASFALTTNTPILGAIAGMVASANFSFSGSLIPYAIGSMSGTTEEAGLTNAGIANSVWNSFLSNYTETGSAGKALATASSGGVDLVAMAQAILDAAALNPIHANVKKMNSTTLLGTGIEADKWRGNV